MEEHIHQHLTPTHPSTYLHKHSHIHISMYTHTQQVNRIGARQTESTRSIYW